jgi:hypothetical protein
MCPGAADRFVGGSGSAHGPEGSLPSAASTVVSPFLVVKKGVVAEEEPNPLGSEILVNEQRLDQQAGRDGQDRTQDESPHESGTETDRAIGFAAMNNAFAAMDDSAALQAIWTVWDRWRFRLCGTSGWCCCPNPFSDADRDAGYVYQLSILQAEFSLTGLFAAVAPQVHPLIPATTPPASRTKIASSTSSPSPVAADASRRICVSRTSMSADSMKRGSAHQHQDPVSRSGAARMLLIRRGDVRRNRRVTNRFASGESRLSVEPGRQRSSGVLRPTGAISCREVPRPG